MDGIDKFPLRPEAIVIPPRMNGIADSERLIDKNSYLLSMLDFRRAGRRQRRHKTAIN
jgi:hypothetical protein